MVGSVASYNAVEILTIGIGDKDLSEYVARNELHDVFDTIGIELVEEIVEQQDGGSIAMVGKEIILRQLEGYEVCLALSLRAYALHGVFAQRHLHIVAVYAMGGIAKYNIALTCFGQLLHKRPIGKV